MGEYEKLYEHVILRRSDANVPFAGLRGLLKRLGFEERIKGDHHIFTREPRRRDPQSTAAERQGQTVPGEAGARSDLELQSNFGGLIMNTKYEIIIFWSAEDNAFVAEVPELPGCMADGNSYQEALSNAEQIIQEWIDTANELGRPVPEPRGRLAYA